MLTHKQHELLMFINERINDKGIPPSYEEMKEKLQLRSKSGIHRLITGLEERGFIRRLPHRARAIKVLQLPENITKKETLPENHQVSNAARFFPNVIQGEFGTGKRTVTERDGTVQLPLAGKIAAGLPIEALQDNSNQIDIPASMIGGGEHYALLVEGDSMIDAGILDGDTVLIRRGNIAENGSIVVAFVENQEVTLKRLRRKGDSIALEPANNAFETRIFGPEQVEVQGVLVGLLRKY
ncbi:MAG: repressor LexA [Magnetovibrio sp.]|nr:repressor LexA [Magnetovibrio sp.]